MLALFSVSNLDDAGPGSLRDAVETANKFPGADEVEFDVYGISAPRASLLLSSGEIEITEELIIRGPTEWQLILDAQEQSRIFNFTGESGDFVLYDLKLVQGKTTGANTEAQENTYSGGAIRFASDGTLSLYRSTVSNSSTVGDFANGGGIFSSGSIVLEDSTVSANQTQGEQAHGGGIHTAKVYLQESTISGNRTLGPIAHGGGISFVDTAAMYQSTVTNNHGEHETAMGGGFWNYLLNHKMGITGSIIAGNTAGSFGNDLPPGEDAIGVAGDEFGRPIKFAAYSLIGDTSSLHPDHLQDIGRFDGLLLDVDPLLRPLADNGGSTATHALFGDSPAFNASVPGVCSQDLWPYDQRGEGFFREEFGRADIGAFELQVPITTLLVDTVVDELDYDVREGHLSLREAVSLANIYPGEDTIVFRSSLSGQTITLNGTHIDITYPVVIDAKSLDENVNIDANNQSRIFNIPIPNDHRISIDVTIRGLNLNNGKANPLFFPDRANLYPFDGGAIRGAFARTLILDEINVTNSQAPEGAGGGIFAINDLTLINSKVSGNKAQVSGGGIYAKGDLKLTDSLVIGNSTLGYRSKGGGLFGGKAYLTNTTVHENSSHSGGGVYAYDVFLANSTITRNMSVSGGAGIFAVRNATASQSLIENNQATGGLFGGGGGILAEQVDLFRTMVRGNEVNGSGGGIRAERYVTLTESSVLDNHSGSLGGGIWGRFEVNLVRSLVSGNRATGNRARGGGILADDDVTLINSTISNNAVYGSGSYGGGLAAADSITISHSTITGNRANEGTGGGIHHSDTTGDAFLIENSIIAGNTSFHEGPDIWHRSGDPGSLQINYSLLSDTADAFVNEATSIGNLLNVDPLLGPLANNGGPTWTHTLLPDSPALNAGDPDIAFLPNEKDQRGTGYSRVAFDRIDIGAYEAQTIPSADYVEDDTVDGFDFLAWQRGFGKTDDATRANGNSDDDTDVDASDLAAWRVSSLQRYRCRNRRRCSLTAAAATAGCDTQQWQK